MSYNKQIKIYCICTSLLLQMQTEVSKLEEKITLNYHVNTNDTSLSTNKILFGFPLNRSREQKFHSCFLYKLYIPVS